MPALESAHRNTTMIRAVREVRVGIPYERRREIAEFYVSLLGLRPWPPHRQLPGGWGVGDPLRGVFLEFRHDPAIDPLRARVGFTVSSIQRLQTLLAARNWPFELTRGFSPGDDCLTVSDPAGHRVEFRENRLL